NLRISWENVDDMLRLADRYEVLSLHDRASEFLEYNFKTDPIRALLMADEYSLRKTYKESSKLVLEVFPKYKLSNRIDIVCRFPTLTPSKFFSVFCQKFEDYKDTFRNQTRTCSYHQHFLTVFDANFGNSNSGKRSEERVILNVGGVKPDKQRGIKRGRNGARKTIPGDDEVRKQIERRNELSKLIGNKWSNPEKFKVPTESIFNDEDMKNFVYEPDEPTDDFFLRNNGNQVERL
ncbi:8177_t:CDS:2, partial [Entrophospora sp. SA101]